MTTAKSPYASQRRQNYLLMELRSAKAVTAALIAQAAEVPSPRNCEALIGQAELILSMATELKAILLLHRGNTEGSPPSAHDRSEPAF